MQSYHELAVAVTYITRLVQSQRAAAGVTCQALDVFQERLYEGLGQRLKQSWYPPFPAALQFSSFSGPLPCWLVNW